MFCVYFFSVVVGYIEDDGHVRGLNFDTPLETPLHVKRRRLFNPSELSVPITLAPDDATPSTSYEVQSE